MQNVDGHWPFETGVRELCVREKNEGRHRSDESLQALLQSRLFLPCLQKLQLTLLALVPWVWKHRVKGHKRWNKRPHLAGGRSQALRKTAASQTPRQQMTRRDIKVKAELTEENNIIESIEELGL